MMDKVLVPKVLRTEASSSFEKEAEPSPSLEKERRQRNPSKFEKEAEPPPPPEGKREGRTSGIRTSGPVNRGNKRYTKTVCVFLVWHVVGPQARKTFTVQRHLKMRVTKQIFQNLAGYEDRERWVNHLFSGRSIFAKTLESTYPRSVRIHLPRQWSPMKACVA